MKSSAERRGLSAARKRSRLSLLPSGPDEVHGLVSRRTRVSSYRRPSKDNCILFVRSHFASDRQSLSWYPRNSLFLSDPPSAPLFIARSSAEERQSESRRPFSLSHSAGDLSFSFSRHPQKFRFIDRRSPERFCLRQFAAGGLRGSDDDSSFLDTLPLTLPPSCSTRAAAAFRSIVGRVPATTKVEPCKFLRFRLRCSVLFQESIDASLLSGGAGSLLSSVRC